jgi:NDP-hexose-3-ketoreductase
LSSILIIGYSNIAQKRIIPALNNIDSIVSIEVASKSKKPSIEGKLKKHYNNYELALNKFKGNLVYISLSNHLHDKYLKVVCDKGFDCIIDKPAFLKKSTLKYIEDKKKNIFIAESVVFHEHPAWKKSIEILGGSQNIFNVHAYFTVPMFDENNYRMKKKYDGGVDTDMAAYSVGIGRWLWDSDPIKVNLSNINYINDLIVSFSIMLTYKENKTVTGFFGFGYEYKNEISMFSESGYVDYQRTFSPPSDLEIEIKGMIEQNAVNEKTQSFDTFKSFLEKVIYDSAKGNKIHWTQNTINTYNDYALLKESIYSQGKDLS